VQAVLTKEPAGTHAVLCSPAAAGPVRAVLQAWAQPKHHTPVLPAHKSSLLTA